MSEKNEPTGTPEVPAAESILDFGTTSQDGRFIRQETDKEPVVTPDGSPEQVRDVDVKALMKNAFRQSKVHGETASRVRVPGGVISAESLEKIVKIAEWYGDGTIFLTNRQGIEIPGIRLEDREAVNAELQEVIPGARLCPFGCYDTTAFAKRMDKAIFPHDRHVKIAFTGCSNDCAHVALNDFGIIGMTEPQYDPDRCIGCEQCVNWCRKRSVGALSIQGGKVVRDENLCIGCGVCVVYCPTRAWTRSKEHYFRVKLLGRTGKQNPRLAEDFARWIDEDSIIKMAQNVYAYIEEYIDPNAVEHKEHIGYIVDRTGFDEFVKWALKDVELPEKCQQAQRVYWGGKRYDRDNELR